MAENTQKDPEMILCDMCTEEDRKPARKTCMKCEISMCVQHLQAHLTTPVLLQTHPLTEPMVLCGTTKCPQHGKLLEYYCLDDMTCVCVSCAIEDQHRLHNMKTFSTAHKELMEKLKAEQEALRGKTEDDNLSLEKWEKSESEKLSHCGVRLIEAVTNLRDISLASVKTSVSARMVSIKTSKSSIEAAQQEKDTFRFLQMYSQVHQDVEKAKAVDLRRGLEPGSDRDKLVQEIRQNGERMVKQASNFWGSLLTLLDPEHHQELVATGPDLFFEPEIFPSSMSLSNNKRKVLHGTWMGECSATLLIRSTLPIPNFLRWVVRLSKKYNWMIGFCGKDSVNDVKNGPVYALSCEDVNLSCLTTAYEDCPEAPSCPQGFGMKMNPGVPNAENRKLTVSSTALTYQGEKEDEPVPRPETVEVCWNFLAASLSFFSRIGQHQREEICTLEMSLNNWDLVPFVQLKMKNAENTATTEKSWKCSCGKVHTMNGSRYISSPFQFECISMSSNCSCGKKLGGPDITELVCELC
ncbi:tripartite motif-containing protein 16 [Parambassis ranga]|uniref:Tripartite motif-containing protein 16 n=1 Tax=Parambassis ranga TaxID=210632 RepID=A0A6P7K700_9TELE|nr:tripartite motif-containing protein 16-like [Parambassis ranga]